MIGKCLAVRFVGRGLVRGGGVYSSLTLEAGTLSQVRRVQAKLAEKSKQ